MIKAFSPQTFSGMLAPRMLTWMPSALWAGSFGVLHLWLSWWWPIKLLASMLLTYAAVCGYKEWTAHQFRHPNKRSDSACVITGGTHGIGFALAKLFARDGYNLFIIARYQDELQRAKMELEGINSKIKVIPIVNDLYSEKGADQVFTEIRAKAAENRLHVDHVCNNVGMCIRGDFLELPLVDQLGMMQLNMSNVVKLSYYFGNQFKDEIRANPNDPALRFRFLTSSSFASLMFSPFLSVYSGTKAFVHYFTISFNEELQQQKYQNRITCTSLCPGYTMAPSLLAPGILNSIAIKLDNYDSPDRVARAGYRALMEGDTYLLVGFFNNLTYWTSLLLPMQLSSKLGKFFNSDWEDAKGMKGLHANKGWPQDPSASQNLRSGIVYQQSR